MITAIVIANDHYNSLGVIRSLGEKKIPVIVILTTLQSTFVEKSKYVTKYFNVEEDEKVIVKKIHSICKSDRKYYVIPTTDFSSAVLDKYYFEFPSNIILSQMEGHMLEAQDKQNMRLIAHQCGLLVPKGEICEFKFLERFIENWSVFPAIVKPLVSIEGNKSDILIVNGHQALMKALISFQNKKYNRVLVEEYIGSLDEYMIEIMGYCSKKGPFIGGIIQKIREFPIRNGSTAYAKVLEKYDEIDLNAINKLLSYFPFTGLFDLEFKYANGKNYFIECNYRNGAPSYALTQREMNLPYLWIKSYDFDFVNESKSKFIKNPYFMCEHIDVINLLKKDVGFIEWWPQFIKSRKIFFQIKDIKPCIVYYSNIFFKMLKKINKEKVLKLVDGLHSNH